MKRYRGFGAGVCTRVHTAYREAVPLRDILRSLHYFPQLRMLERAERRNRARLVAQLAAEQHGLYGRTE